MNRMGQFNSFARSCFVRDKLGDTEKLLPSFRQLKIFRDKHAAHRSMDAPRPDESDDPSLAMDHALSLGIQAGQFQLKPQVRARLDAMHKEPLSKEISQKIDEHNSKLNIDDYEAIFEIYDATTTTYVTFSLERDHEAICGEAHRLLEQLLA